MSEPNHNIGSERRVDAVKLVTGRAAFVDDIAVPGLLHARILRSPHAHARIARIDTARARAMRGVACVVTHEDVPRVPYTTAGEGWPESSPYDCVMLDRKLRFVGDRVAVVAADDPELALRACAAIEVDYEPLSAILDPERAMDPGAVVIHDEDDARGIADASLNLACAVEAEVGDVGKGFAAAEHVFEASYRVPYVQHCSIEPHVTISWLDEDERLIVRTSTDVPFHVRRILAPLLGIPVQRIRVIRPRVGGGFGGKHEVLTEDLCGMLALRTGHPVRLEYSREEELTAARARHPQIVRIKSGIKKGRFTAIELGVLQNVGAYAPHAQTVLKATGSGALSLYRSPNLRYTAKAVYTNLAVAGAFRGSGCPQALFALESHVDEIALSLGEDPLEFRRRNHVQEGDATSIGALLAGAAQEPARPLVSCGLADVIRLGAKAAAWGRKRKPPVAHGPLRRGLGMALATQAPGTHGEDRSAASIRMNEDGSFNLLVATVDVAGGSDSLSCQVAAEILGVPLEKIVLSPFDSDVTPFDPGARSLWTQASGRAVEKAARAVLSQILEVGGKLLGRDPGELYAGGGKVGAKGGRSVTYQEIALRALYQDQAPIQSTASHVAADAPMSFAAVFAEVLVDTETGLIRVLRIVEAIDCGEVPNPQTIEAQVEGAVVQAVGQTLYEHMPVDALGRMLFRSWRDYSLASSIDVPEISTLLVPTQSRSGPLGAKDLAELPVNGPAAAIANAVAHAVGVRIRELPLTPDRVLAALAPREET